MPFSTAGSSSTTTITRPDRSPGAGALFAGRAGSTARAGPSGRRTLNTEPLPGTERRSNVRAEQVDAGRFTIDSPRPSPFLLFRSGLASW